MFRATRIQAPSLALPLWLDRIGEKPENLAKMGGGTCTMREWALICMAGALAVAGCTSPSPEALAANDPFEPLNRDTLVRNGQIDRYVVMPTVGIYFLLVPPGGRRGVHNFLGNLS